MGKRLLACIVAACALALVPSLSVQAMAPSISGAVSYNGESFGGTVDRVDASEGSVEGTVVVVHDSTVEETVSVPRTVALLGTGSAGLAGYAVLRLRSLRLRSGQAGRALRPRKRRQGPDHD